MKSKLYEQTATYRQLLKAERNLWGVLHKAETEHVRTAVSEAITVLSERQRDNAEFYERMVAEGRTEIVEGFGERIAVLPVGLLR